MLLTLDGLYFLFIIFLYFLGHAYGNSEECNIVSYNKAVRKENDVMWTYIILFTSRTSARCSVYMNNSLRNDEWMEWQLVLSKSYAFSLETYFGVFSCHVLLCNEVVISSVLICLFVNFCRVYVKNGVLQLHIFCFNSHYVTFS